MSTATDLVTAPPTMVAAGTTSALFGLEFVIHGTTVPITSTDIANAATNGIEFTLPGPVDLGTIADAIAWVNSTFSVNIPSASNLPPPLDAVANKLVNIDFGVQAFHVKIPPKGSGGSVAYTLQMSAAFSTPVSLIPNSTILQISGAAFGVTNETSS